MITIGLTGSIGMGKSTTAKLFAEEGAFVWDADKAVHRLYAADGAGARAIKSLVPDAVGADGVDREALRDAIIRDPALLQRVEAAIHPLVAADRAAALAAAEKDGVQIAVCDIPLLFETGGDAAFDHIVTVSAPAHMQRARVLARPGMHEAALKTILDKQTPDAEKRRRADFVIETGRGVEVAREQIRALIRALSKEAGRCARS